MFISQRAITNRAEGYIKYISFAGTDGYHYCMVFFQLTNNNDILLAQFIRDTNDSWTLIQINPEDCIKE